MENQQLREQLAAELKRQRLPSRYITRLLAEWDDHLADLQDERNAEMNRARSPETSGEELQSNNIIDLQRRFGEPAQLAAFTAKHYHDRSFLGRHPIFTFVFAPLPLMLLSWIALLLPVFAVGYLLDFLGVEPGEPRNYPYLMAIGIVTWSFSLMVAGPLLSAMFLCRVARRNVVKWHWAVSAVIVIAVLCTFLSATGRQATNDHWIPESPGNGCVMIGFLVPTSLRDAPLFLAKFATAAFIGLLLVRRAQQLQQADQNGKEVSPFRLAA